MKKNQKYQGLRVFSHLSLLTSCLLVVSSLLFMTGCSEDLGNYDYHEINEVTISGIDSKYEVQTGITTLNITPVITTSMNDDSQLEYEWRAVVGYSSSKLIGTERNLNYEVDLEPGNYDLYYRVLNKTTGVTAVNKSSLVVGTPYTKGIMLIGQNAQGATKVQMLTMAKDTSLVEDVLGDDVPTLSAPVDIIHTGTGTYARLWLLTEDQAFYLDMKTMKLNPENTFEKVLYQAEDYHTKFIPVDFAPRINKNAGTASYNYAVAAICSNGYVFSGSAFSLGGAYYTEPSNHFNNEYTYFKAKPYMMYSLNGWGGIMYYDMDNERFLKIGAYTDYSTTLADRDSDPFPWNQAAVNRTLTYSENTYNTDGGSSAGNTFSIMKSKDDGTYYIYKFYASSVPAKRDCYTVSTIATDFGNASFYAFSSKRTVVYYTVGSKLYAYDYNKGNEKLYLIKDFGSDQITMMKFDTQIEPSSNFLYIATYSAANGGTLQKFVQGTNPDVVELTEVAGAKWTGLMKIKNMSWRATN